MTILIIDNTRDVHVKNYFIKTGDACQESGLFPGDCLVSGFLSIPPTDRFLSCYFDCSLIGVPSG